MISIIVAASTNNVIGAHGRLPWKISDDLRRFKTLTLGKPIIMGRLTWESIGRPLPGRQNIIITRQTDFVAHACDVVASTAEALEVAGDAKEIMIIGGSQVFESFLPMAHRLYMTRIHAEIDGDVFFPEIDVRSWQLVSSEEHEADAANECPFAFMSYERTGPG